MMQLFMFMDPREWADRLATIDEERVWDVWDEDEMPDLSHVSVADLMDIVRDDEQQESLDEYVREHGIPRPILLTPDRWNWAIGYAGDNDIALVDGHHRFTAAYDANQLVPVLWTNDHGEWLDSVREHRHDVW
jgi:hypothetical protein